MIWHLLPALTITIAAIAIVLVILGMIRRDGRTPARTHGDIPPGWTRNERGALVPPVPHSPQKKAPKHAAPKGSPRETLARRRPLAGRAPYPVAATGELLLEPLNPARPYALPVNDDAETLRLGGWGVRPQLEAERLAKGVIA